MLKAKGKPWVIKAIQEYFISIYGGKTTLKEIYEMIGASKNVNLF